MIDHNEKDFDAIYRGFRWNVPEYFNIGHDVSDKHRDRFDQIALYYENASGVCETTTFGDITRYSNRFANALSGLGIVKGDRVAIILAQRPETVIAHVAIYKLGAIALPLSILFGPDALEYRLRNSGAKAVIVDAQHLPMVAEMRPSLEDLRIVISCDDARGSHAFRRLVNAASENFQPVHTKAEDPAVLIYTSGTTGPPKGALKAHRCLLGNLPGFELSHGFFPRDGDLFWTPADWAWTGGLMDALLPSLHYGVPLLAYEGGKFDPERACHLIDKYRVKNVFMPPTAIKMLMQVRDLTSRYNLELRSIMSAGEQVGVEVLHWADEELNVPLNEMWGQTEFNYLVGNCAAIMDVKPGSMGKPYPGHVVDVLDEQGHSMPDGQVGELAAKRGDPVMFLGYWKDEQATRDKFRGDWFCTGDIGYRDQHGYFWFMGRKDDVISSAGYRIGPGEIEDCLLKHPAVAEAAVIGVPDALRGSIIKAFIVLADDQSPSETLTRNIQESVRARLAAHEYPREVEFIDELPMTTTGKIRRVELRQREQRHQRSR